MNSTNRRQQPHRRYLTPCDVELEYALSKRKQKAERAARRLAFIRAGHRTILYDRAEIERYLAARRIEAVGVTP